MLAKVKQLFQMLMHSSLAVNVSWIFIGNVLHAFFQFILSVYVARFLDLDSNGLIGYATSLITLLGAFCTFGFSSTITLEFAEDEPNYENYIRTAIVSRLTSASIAVVIIQIIIRHISPDEPQLHLVVLCQSMSLLLAAPDYLVYWFRYKDRANLVAIVRLIAFFISAIARVILLNITGSIVLYTIGTILETGFFSLFMLYFYVKDYHKRGKYSVVLFKKMFRTSYPFVLASIMGVIYSQADKLMLKSMVSNSAVAVYNVSLVLANAISIIPQALIEGFRPHIMKAQVNDEERFRLLVRRLYCIVFWISVLYCIFITIFAEPIITILYGEKYISAVDSLSIIVWYISFSFFGSINNLYMVAIKKSKWVQVNTFIGAVVNVILNYILIPPYSIVGAAIASLITQFIAQFLLMYIIKDVRSGIKLMIEGITFQYIR